MELININRAKSAKLSLLIFFTVHIGLFYKM